MLGRPFARVALAAMLAAIPMVAAGSVTPSIELHAMVMRADGRIGELRVEDGGVLRSGDRLQVRVRAPRDGYVYVIAHGSSGRALLLHPFSGDANDARIAADKTMTVPAPGVFLPLDNRPGREMLFAVWSDSPLQGLSSLLVRMEAASGDPTRVENIVRDAYPAAERLAFRHLDGKPDYNLDVISSSMADQYRVTGTVAPLGDSQARPTQPSTGRYAITSALPVPQGAQPESPLSDVDVEVDLGGLRPVTPDMSAPPEPGGLETLLEPVAEDEVLGGAGSKLRAFEANPPAPEPTRPEPEEASSPQSTLNPALTAPPVAAPEPSAGQSSANPGGLTAAISGLFSSGTGSDTALDAPAAPPRTSATPASSGARTIAIDESPVPATAVAAAATAANPSSDAQTPEPSANRQAPALTSASASSSLAPAAGTVSSTVAPSGAALETEGATVTSSALTSVAPSPVTGTADAPATAGLAPDPSELAMGWAVGPDSATTAEPPAGMTQGGTTLAIPSESRSGGLFGALAGLFSGAGDATPTDTRSVESGRTGTQPVMPAPSSAEVLPLAATPPAAETPFGSVAASPAPAPASSTTPSLSTGRASEPVGELVEPPARAAVASVSEIPVGEREQTVAARGADDVGVLPSSTGHAAAPAPKTSSVIAARADLQQPASPQPGPPAEAPAGDEPVATSGGGLFGALGRLFGAADSEPADDGTAATDASVAMAGLPAAPAAPATPATPVPAPLQPAVNLDEDVVVRLPGPSPQALEDGAVLGAQGSRIRALLGETPASAPASAPATPEATASARPAPTVPVAAELPQAVAQTAVAPVPAVKPASPEAPSLEPAPPAENLVIATAANNDTTASDATRSQAVTVTPPLPGLDVGALPGAGDAALPTLRAEQGIAASRSVARAVVMVVTPSGSGSGTLVDRNGHVLTNWHLVDGHANVTVLVKSASTDDAAAASPVRARVLRHSRFADLALLRMDVPPGDVAPLLLGENTSLREGGMLHAIGHPGGGVWTHTPVIVTRVMADGSWYSGQSFLHKAGLVHGQAHADPGAGGAALLDADMNLVAVSAQSTRRGDKVHAVSIDTIRSFLQGSGHSEIASGG